MSEKGYYAGKRTSIRFPVDYPQDVLDFLNKEGAPHPLELIIIGAREKMRGQNQGVFIQGNLTEEKRQKIESNPELQRVAMKFIDELFFSNKSLFSLVAEGVEVKNESTEIDQIQVAEEVRNRLEDLGVDIDDDDDY
jgi:hypothetical protein